MEVVKLQPTRCAICGTEGNSVELYPENFDLQALNASVFSARRLPDRIHYRTVRCKTCGLIRSDPIADPELLRRLYTESSFNYGDETGNLKRTYGGYLRMLDRCVTTRGSLLEIGCGNGFFLQEALSQGYSEVRGVEPSEEAVESADASVRDRIVRDVMRPGLFGPEEFDVVCLFQVLNHIPDPGPVLRECLRVLKPNGLVLCIDHNAGSLSARILGERSPIVDIEHTYLFDAATMSRLFAHYGFDVRRTGSVRNRYSLRYLARLVPLPGVIKRVVLGVLESSALGRIPLSVPLGNLYAIAQKPRGAASDGCAL